jgi:hypothetical protein
VIVIPIFAFLLAAVLWINQSSTAIINSRSQARSCAWRYSQNNCDPSLIPPRCEGILGPASQRELEFGSPVSAGLNAFDTAKNGGDYQGIIGSVMGTLLAPAINEALSNATQATVTKTVLQQPLFGKGDQKFQTHYRLACNLKPRDPMNIASMTWEQFSP